MTEVKSLNVTADTYRHRGWMWRDRGTYEAFKASMKLPLWIDRILTDTGGDNLFVVGKEDGDRNTSYVGSFRRGVEKGRILDAQPAQATYNCNSRVGNGFIVLAERIRAKKPDANKVPRPQWRRPMTKPWEPGTLGGNWVVDSKFVKEISLKTTPPAWADRLWVSTSANTDTFVWVNSKVNKHAHGGELHTAKHAKGIKGHQLSGDFSLDEVVTNSGCHWQLAGVRKKTVQVPVSMVVEAPVVVEPEPDVPLTASAVRAAQEEAYRGPVSGRVSSLNPLLAAPHGTDIHASVAQALDISRSAAKVRLFRDLYTPQPRGKSIIFDYENLERMLLAYCTADAMATVPRTPIGVKPRNLHDEERANALDEAMVRYLNEDLPFPIEWAVEWNELRARLNKEQK